MENLIAGALEVSIRHSHHFPETSVLRIQNTIKHL